MWTRAELKENAKKYFKFNYWKMVLVAFILSLVGGGSGGSVSYTRTVQETTYDMKYMSSSQILAFFAGFMVMFLVIMVIVTLLMIFLCYPLQVGIYRFFVVSHYQKAELGEVGYAFSNSYMNVVKVMFLRHLYIFLWSLLFIIPGIIKAYEYLMIPYILAENPGIDSKDAFAMSKQMMDGNKWAAFVLGLSFYGWIILSVFTCGILGIFYVNPYMQMTYAELYVALKEITFGSYNSGYQNYQGNPGYQGYQPNQNYQGYQPNQNYQGYQPNQNYQGYQPDQNYQGYQQNQNYQQDANYQNYQQGQNYQQDANYQGYQPNQSYQQDTNYQNSQGYTGGSSDAGYQQGQDAGSQGGNWTQNNHQDDNFQL